MSRFSRKIRTDSCKDLNNKDYARQRKQASSLKEAIIEMLLKRNQSQLYPMNQHQKTKTILWIEPLLIGSLIATGYSLTHKFTKFEIQAHQAILKPFKAKETASDQSTHAFTENLQRQEHKTTNISETNSLQRKTVNSQDNNQIDVNNDKNTLQTIQANTQKPRDQSTKRLSESNINHFNDSLSIENQLFFKQYPLNQVIKKLPMP
tara:strand:+ start:58 stop:675 length:618 start_codon:yes stop_codon:yes gene_type:complete